MIFLFTDFGVVGPYVGQVHAVLAAKAPQRRVIDLMHDAPAHDPRAAAYLLAALVREFPDHAICVGVVDPGVGTDRPAVALKADGRWFVGPGNGLFELVRRRAAIAEPFTIVWRPGTLSASFHGRDLFAPVAARLAALGPDQEPPADLLQPDTGDAVGRPGADWPDDLPEIVYADRFGNLMTGIRADTLDASSEISVGGSAGIRHARVFGDAPPETLFWYGNSSGLAEIAVANGSAAARLSLDVGDPVAVR